MRKSHVRLMSRFASAAALVALLLLPAGAAAKSHRRCSLRAGSLTPTLSFPCNRATVHPGQNITFRVRDKNSKAHQYRPFIELTNRRPGRHGRLPRVPGADGFFGQMRAVKGHPTVFTFRAAVYSYPGWWLITPGKYYVQIQQVDDRAGSSLSFYSPVSTIYVR